jgi:hypothetical protein
MLQKASLMGLQGSTLGVKFRARGCDRANDPQIAQKITRQIASLYINKDFQAVFAT